MAKLDMAHWQQRLAEDHTRLQEELAEMEREVVEGADPLAPTRGGVGNHFADDATEMEQQETAMSLRRNVERLLAQVDHALARVAEGTYGTCERCGAAIPVERLEARPYATFCIKDQTLEERR